MRSLWMKKIVMPVLVFALSAVCFVSGALGADVLVRGSDVSYQLKKKNKE